MGENFAELEQSYNKALGENQRLPSGVFRLSRLVQSVDDALNAPASANYADLDSALRAWDAHWTNMEAKAGRWAQAIPGSSAAAVFRSEIFVRHGYAFRGGGYSSSVSSENLEKFQAYVQRAYQALAECADCSRRDPQWHAQMLKVARLQAGRAGHRHATAWEAAVAAFPYYYDIYFEAAMTLAPQWGGSAAAVESMARSAADRTQDREGQALYARIYWSASRLFGGDPVKNGQAEWPRLRAGFDDIVQRYPDPWNLNSFARFACQQGDVPTLRRVFRLIGNQIDLLAWGGPRQLERCLAVVDQRSRMSWE
jgi:hypothetical protein